MDHVRIAKGLALAHVVIAALGWYHFQGFESRPLPWQDYAFAAFYPLPPILAAWGGAKLADTQLSRIVLLVGLAAAVLASVVIYLIVISASDSEPLAALLLLIGSLAQAAGLALLMPIVWIVARSKAKLPANLS